MEATIQLSYNINAPRRAVNLTANSELVNMVRSAVIGSYKQTKTG